MKRALTILRSLLLGLIFLTLFAGILHGGAVYDFDGDGRTDMIVKRNNGYGSEFTWLVSLSSGGTYAPNLGYPTAFGSERFNDSDALGDYDGDGRWDIAIARYERARHRVNWHILNSGNGSLSVRRWPGTADGVTALPQDYDGDGKTDLAVWRSGTWEILRSIDGVFTTGVLGGEGQPFMGGDYDGDHKADLAEVYSSGGQRHLQIKFSVSGQIGVYQLGTPPSTGVVAGDFDGDGTADVTASYGNRWQFIRSSDGQIESRGNSAGGVYSDKASPGDYDGDGMTDVVFLRGEYYYNPGPTYYFLIAYSGGGFIGRPWGLYAIDLPVVDCRSVIASFSRPADLNPTQIKEAARLPRLVSR